MPLRSPMGSGLLVLASLVVVVGGLRAASSIIAPVLFAVVLSILFAPFLRWAMDRGVPKAIALILLSLAIVAVLGLVILIVYVSLTQLQDNIPGYEEMLRHRLDPLKTALQERGIDARDLFSTDLLDGQALVRLGLTFVRSLISSTVSVFFFLMTLLLFLADTTTYKAKFVEHDGSTGPFMRRFRSFASSIQTQYRVQTLSNLLSATAITVELFAFRIDFALLWGFLAFVLAYIPNIGLILACLPAVILAFILHGLATALLVAAIATLLNAIMDNAVTPRFMGEGLNIPISVIFVSLILWGWVFGPLGAFLAIPMTLAIRAVLESSSDTRFLANLLRRTAPQDGDIEGSGVEAS